MHFKSSIKNVILAFLPASVEKVSLFLPKLSHLDVALGGLPGDLAGDFAFEALTGVDFLLAGL